MSFGASKSGQVFFFLLDMILINNELHKIKNLPLQFLRKLMKLLK